MTTKSFIETQFPISRLSAESYKERKANLGQTLTRLGKWWGRKPLVLVRASILGMLMPASDDPKRDREVFLKLMTMDDDGVWRRRKATVRDVDLIKEATAAQRGLWNSIPDDDDETQEAAREAIWSELSPEARERLEATRRFRMGREQFDALEYQQRLKHCLRPEHVDGPDPAAWRDINEHLETSATSLPELVVELGHRRFGHRPRVGDAFCGGGSIPFEACRLGCEVYASDLSPVATLLTWAAIHLVGGGRTIQDQVREAQQAAFDQSTHDVAAWGIEHDERGWRVDALLYCIEVRPPECDYAIPLAPTWMIGERSKTIGRLRRGVAGTVDIEIVTSPPEEDWNSAVLGGKLGGTGTIADGRVRDPFDAGRSWAVEELRGYKGLRLWSRADFVPISSDIYQERLYCIRWMRSDGTKVYEAPRPADLERERRVLRLLEERYDEWARLGLVPSRAIPTDGEKTEEPIRTRGWTHWHHLFTPRQLLVNGLLGWHMLARVREAIDESVRQALHAALMLGLGRLANWNSRLSRWSPDRAKELGMDVFSNQALNTMFSYSTRPLARLDTTWPIFVEPRNVVMAGHARVEARDARDVDSESDIWITDPPYADAINYHELAEFFLSWFSPQIQQAFPTWNSDGRTALAVRGANVDFKHNMVRIYSHLALQMADEGMQLVQFTHQDPSVWADLGMILWASGLRVTAAWTIATETGGTQKGNYVQGTVLLVLRKRSESIDGFLGDIYPLVEDEVRSQIDSMRRLDEDGEPNFGDTDYQLAAYAAALRVLTEYQTLDGQDIAHELFRVTDGNPVGRRAKRAAPSKSQFEQVIERGIQIACDYLVPRGLDTVWPSLTGDERLYLRALDVESRGERRQGVYQELARGFGVREVKSMLHSASANTARVRTASEFGKRDLDGGGIAGTKLRQLLFAIHATVSNETPEAGRSYLKESLRDYWGDRQRMIAILDWLSGFAQVDAMKHWNADSDAARLLAGRLRSDHG